MPSFRKELIRVLAPKDLVSCKHKCITRKYLFLQNARMKFNGNYVARVVDKDFVYQTGLRRSGRREEELWWTQT